MINDNAAVEIRAEYYRDAKKREREVREEERKEYNVNYKFPPMPWVTLLIDGVLYIGAKPRTEEHVGYLLQNLQINCFVSLLPTNTDLYYESYMPYVCNGCDLTKDNITTHVVPLDLSTFKKSGITKEQQLESKAVWYVKFCKMLLHKLETQKNKKIYLFHETGYMEEVFVGVCLWVLLQPDVTQLPSDIIKWIETNERLLDGDSDNKELMQAIWKRVQHEERVKTLFFGKRVKK
jgi:hypothetical protein